MIVGFPGEDGNDLDLSLDAIRRACFLKVHLFPFSPRPGTAAAALDGRVAGREVLQRKKRMQEIGERTAAEEKARWLGKTVDVLFEQRSKKEPSWHSGFSGNYLRVCARTEADATNTLRPVRLLRLDSRGTFEGEIVT
jgi:threonylcarbamoyladenosine tRNA methylthiotransferase MtaB